VEKKTQSQVALLFPPVTKMKQNLTIFSRPHFFTAKGGPDEKRCTLVTLSVCVELVIFESSW
jgi:hypothetical protein